MRHPWTDHGLVAMFACAAAGSMSARPVAAAPTVGVIVVGLVAVGWGVRWPPARLATMASVALLAGAWAAGDLRAMERAPHGPWFGTVTLRTDPDRIGAGVKTVVQADGFRYEAWAWGAPARSLERRLAGEQVVVVGERRRADGIRRSALWARHVVGRLEVDSVAGVGAGSATTRAANRVHRAVNRVGADWPVERRALLSGLVLGNDAAVPPATVEAFRTAGLAHLTAVSGQNVALLLTLAAPLLARTNRAWRWLLTVTIVGWFAVLTRFEPSVLRASAMALLAVTATVLGRDRRPVRLLALAGTALILVDPLLVRTVSFWLSMSATTGLLVVAPALIRVLDAWQWAGRGAGRRAVGTALATTAGAQIGVLAISTVVFGLPSSVALVTNLSAVPAAGFVMMSGPALAALGAVAPQAAGWLAAPIQALVWWVAGVARIGQMLAPPRVVDLVVWTLMIALTATGIGRRRRGR